jgi:flagellar motor switch protein FliM
MGKQEDFAGAVILDSSLTDALVEVQTLGRVDREAREARPPTRIDAALCRGYATHILGGLIGKPGVQPLGRLHPSRHLSLSAQLEMEVATPSLIVVELDLSFAGSERTGRFSLMLPDKPRVSQQIPDEKSNAKSGAQVENQGEVLWQAKARLEATLPKVSLPLGDLLALKVGDTIALPKDAVGSLSLSGMRLGVGRKTREPDYVIMGRLGQKEGDRAVKLAVQDVGEKALGAPDSAIALPAAAPAADLDDTLALPASAEPALPVADQPEPDALPAMDLDDPAPDAADGLGDLPDLGDLDASLGDLPDLPDLPDLDASSL